MATIKDLLARYNEMAVQVDLPPRKSFKTKSDAESHVAHVEALEAQVVQQGDRRRRIKFDYQPDPDGIREARPGTKRARVVELLRAGTTLEDVQEAIGWNRMTAIEGIRLVATKLGWGMRQDEDGVIRVYE